MPPVVATSNLPFWQALLVTTAVATVVMLIGVALLGWRDRRTAT